MHGRLESVNVGSARTTEWNGRTVRSAIWKAPVAGTVAVRGVNVAGDDQGDRAVHGGIDKAVYAYAAEDYRWWAGQLGRELDPGTFGDNLTVSGLDLGAAVIGERWQVGSAVLEVSQPRTPCFKLGMRMGDRAFPRRFAKATRPGAYLRIVREGEVRAGDPLTVAHRPTHGVTVGLVAHAYHHDRTRADALLAAPQLAGGWRDWARSVSG